MGRRNDIDWEAIEREYRLGQKTLRQLAKHYGVETSSITRRARSHGWVQDKADEVRTRAANLLLQATADEATGNATLNAHNATPTETQIKVAARVSADVVLSHRKGLVELSRLRDSMIDKLKVLVVESKDLQGNVDVLRRLTDVDEKLRRGEREAFGITPDGGGGGSSNTARVVVVTAKDLE